MIGLVAFARSRRHEIITRLRNREFQAYARATEQAASLGGPDAYAAEPSDFEAECIMVETIVMMIAP